MEKITETLICDICKKEISCPECVNAEELKSKHRFKVLVRRYFDGTDGRTFYESPKYDYVTIDICDECLEKAVVLKDVGVQCVDVQFDEKEENNERHIHRDGAKRN